MHSLIQEKLIAPEDTIIILQANIITITDTLLTNIQKVFVHIPLIIILPNLLAHLVLLLYHPHPVPLLHNTILLPMKVQKVLMKKLLTLAWNIILQNSYELEIMMIWKV